MNVLKLAIVLSLITTGLMAQNGQKKYDKSEKSQVKAAVLKAYVNGIHNGGPIEDIEAGFHPEFRMYVLKDNAISQVSIADWVSRIKSGRAKNPDRKRSPASADFNVVKVTGTTAVAVLDLSRDGKLLYTDFLTLHKFDEGWRIVSKAFTRH